MGLNTTFLLGPGLFSGAIWLVSGRVMGMFGAFSGFLGLDDSHGTQTTEPQTNSGIPWDSHFPKQFLIIPT